MVENLTSEVSVPQEDNRYFSFNLFHLTSVKLQEYREYPHTESISKQILTRGYLSIKLHAEDQNDLLLPRLSTQNYQVVVTEINCPGRPFSQIYEEAFQIESNICGWTSNTRTSRLTAQITKILREVYFIDVKSKPR